MKPKSKPEVVELDVQQLEAKLQRIEQVMGEETARPFRLLLGWYLSLLQLVQKKNTSIGKLRRLLFGARTERTHNVTSEDDSNDKAADEPSPPTSDSDG